ncbi:MAG: hypothetical protein IJ416_04120 [Ruminiclostridium sp.]|nr:hypothetical protein [Ruminiclostridium sp.]
MLSVGRVAELSNITAATAPKAADKVTEEKTTTLASEHTDKFVKSEASFTPAYTKATVTDNRSGDANQDKDSEAKASANKSEKGEFVAKSSRQLKNESMKDMVSQLLTGQASANSDKSSLQAQLNEILSSFDIEPIEADSEDFWGAEKTAQRILDFAKSLAGGDKDAISTLRDAFEKGFGDSEKIWGDKLPDVCQDTYDLVQKGFDDWEKELSSENEEVEAEEGTEK